MAQAARSSRRRPLPVLRRRSGAGGAELREALATWSAPALSGTAFLALYILGHLDVIDTTPALAIDAFLLVATVLYFPMRYVHRLDPRGRVAAAGFAAIWLAVAYFPIYERIYPGQRIATAEARPAALPLRLPTAGHGRLLDLVIDAHLARPEPGGASVARYSVTIEADATPPETVSGEFKESWTRQRQGRREAVDVLTERDATRVTIRNPADGDLRVRSMAVSGQAEPVLTLSVYPHRLPPWWVALPIAAALLVGAVVFDRATGAGETAASLAVATGAVVTAAFFFPSIGSPHPTFRELAGAAIVGALVGGPIGGLVAWTFRRRFGSPAPRPRPRGR